MKWFGAEGVWEEARLDGVEGKGNHEDASGVDEDCPVGGWLLGCGVWSVGGVFKDLGVTDVLGGMQVPEVTGTSLII